MASVETSVVHHYNLQTLYPLQWPAELDDSDEDATPENRTVLRRSKSRYSALERSASDRRSVIPGFQKTDDGRANLVQKDEPDPLGGMDSVVRSLRSRGLPVDEDSRMRNKFLLSSTTFSPAMFLSQTHSNDSTETLKQGLEHLTKSIDQKSASLKVLVESNFERFVRAKATIDNVYTEMRNQGAENEPPPSPISPRHSRQVSRSSMSHYRNFSSGSAAGMNAPAQPPASKNALRKETEYGVQGIKGPLLEVSQKAEDVWGPALGGRERESSLKFVVEAVDSEKNLYLLGAKLNKAIKQKDYASIVEQYNVARNYCNQAKTVADSAASGRANLDDKDVRRILITSRMWADVEEQVKVLKREIWRRLSSVQSILPLPGASQAEEHMELIGVLLELGVDDNPIWVWLLSRYDYLKTKIMAISERSKVEIEILRRRLAAAEKPSQQVTALYMRQTARENPGSLDTDDVLEMWETVLTFLTKLLSLSSGLLGEVVDFWDSAKSFIDGHKQKALPTGFEGQSKKHHRLSEAGVRDLQNGSIDLINVIRGSVFALFTDPPTEDISQLCSPLPPTPSTPLSAVYSPTDGRLGKIDLKNVPPPSPKRGEAWEDFAFWPPYSNSLSATHYLSKILALVATAANEMASLGPVTSGNPTLENIKTMLGAARERCSRATIDAWAKDSECCKSLEDWTRAADRRDQTKMPMHFMAFEKFVILGLQRMLYLSEAMAKPSPKEILKPPPAGLLQIVKTQFVSSIYKTLSGMVENAEKPVQVDEDDWVIVNAALTNTGIDSSSTNTILASDAIDASSRNVRMLLTLSNLKALRVDFVPQLISLFENCFSVKLMDESKTIRDVLGQTDSKIFQLYTRPTVAILAKTIKEGINAPDWIPTTNKPTQVKPYVYATMMMLVMVHTEVSTTVSTTPPSAAAAVAAATSNPSSSNTNLTLTATNSNPNTNPPTSSALLHETLSFLLENISASLLEAFSTRKPNHYTLAALMQATLDTEFIAQTMSQYATMKASDTQSQIYMELDKRTNNESRAKLQQELGEMRGVLKRLREGSRGSFGCFKKIRERKGGSAAGGGSGGGGVGGAGVGLVRSMTNDSSL